MKPADYQPFAPEVHLYVDGQMTADAERDFERKLKINPELKTQVESLQRSIELLGSLPTHEPKEGFAERVIGRIREGELADRARSQISVAPTPPWKSVVMVGFGAAAAALVLAMVGMPGMFGGEDPSTIEGFGGGDQLPVARATATEADLLPSLADHQMRFESLRRNVQFTRVEDPDLQRQLVSMELEYSDLARRNRWLGAQISDLPANRRADYQRFIEHLDSALTTLRNEIDRSRTERSPMNMSAIDVALDKVVTPGGKVAEYKINVAGASPIEDDPTVKIAEAGGLDEITLYSLVRKAEYRHDHQAVVEAANFYLKWQSSGRLKDQANASAIAANLRMGQDDVAANRFINTFGAYDEDMTEEQRVLIRGALTEAEYKRLAKAREEVRRD